MIFKNKIKEIEQEIEEVENIQSIQHTLKFNDWKIWYDKALKFNELKSNLKLLKELQEEELVLIKAKGEDYYQAEKRNNHFKEQGRQETLEKVKEKIKESDSDILGILMNSKIVSEESIEEPVLNVVKRITNKIKKSMEDI